MADRSRMVRKQQSPVLLFFKVVLMLLIIGGIGAWSGTQLVLFAGGEPFGEVGAAGPLLLLTSAFLAVPGVLLLCVFWKQCRPRPST